MLAFWILACNFGRGSSETVPPPEVSSGPAEGAQGNLDPSESASPSGFQEDVAELRFSGPQEAVLVTARSKPLITTEAFNAWLGTYPLDLKSSETAAARREALEQMVAFKLIVRKAKLAGYQARIESTGNPADDRSMVLTYIRDQVSSLQAISDRNAREFLASGDDRARSILQADAPDDIKLMVAKGTLAGERLWETVQGWMRESNVQYHGPAQPAHVDEVKP